MTYNELTTLFKCLNSTKYITECKFKGVSNCTVRRWKKWGYDETLKRAFGYCKVCDTFFKKEHSHQILCGKRSCLLEHNRFMSRVNGYQKGRKKEQSQITITRIKALRRISGNKATRRGLRYTKEEIKKIFKYDKTTFELALELGRSVSSIENARVRFDRYR